MEPGKVIANEMARNGLSQRDLAAITGEHYQTINAILAGRRKISLPLSVKMDEALHLVRGFTSQIQLFYLLQHLENDGRIVEIPHPKIRKVVFWDTDMNLLDWTKNKDFIIKRVRERGNKEEINQTEKYYERKQNNTSF